MIDILAMQKIDSLLNDLKQSPTGAELVKFAEGHAVEIKFVNYLPLGMHAGFDSSKNSIEILINQKDNTPNLLMMLSHELRHAWQLHNGLLNKTERLTEFIEKGRDLDSSIFTLFHGLFIERRFSEADAYATSTQVVHELSQINIIPNNYMDYFSSDAYPSILDNTFNEKIINNKENMHNGVARRASFDAFFEKSLCLKNWKWHATTRQIYDSSVFLYFQTINKALNDGYQIPLWKACLKDTEKCQKLKDVFNTSAKDIRNQLPDINYLNKYGHMETGGNYLTDTAGKSLHSKYYLGSGIAGNIIYNRIWKKLQNTAKKVYGLKKQNRAL